MSCSLNIKNVSYQTLFSNITFDVGHKQKIAIIGENGCGKSTLLEILAGLKKPTNYDNFELFHHHIQAIKDFDIHRNKIGFLFQDSNDQFIAPTVMDDVIFGLLTNGIDINAATKKANDILLKLEISHLAHKNPFALSGGEKKLVALAGILVSEPELIFLDEPTNNLNTKAQENLAKLLNSIDKSMVIVSHHNDFINLVVNKIYTLTSSGLIEF